MPSTAVAARQNAWKRIAWKYHKRDALTAARRLQQLVAAERDRQQRKALSKRK